MKIAIVNHGLYPDSIGGMERHTYNLASFLEQAGMDVHVLVPEPKTQTFYPFLVHHLPWPRKPFWLWSNYGFSQQVGQWIDQNKPDLAFGQGFNLWGYLKKRKIPCIFHPHGLEMFGQTLTIKERIMALPFKYLVKYHVKHSDKVISLGGKLTEILMRKAFVPKSKLCEIPNAVGLEYVQSSANRIPNSFLFVGRLAFNKGIDLLTKAFHGIQDLDFHLTIVGDGPFRQHVQNLCGHKIQYLSKVMDQELITLYQQHECLLFTSRFEGMPTVILEAMANQCAIIATCIGAVETMVNQENGILISPKVEELVRAIKQFLSYSSDQRKKMGQAGQRRVKTQFTWPVQIPKYQILFEELLM